MSTENFKETIKNIPNKPGVYRYYSRDNEVLYIGKAKNLKNRVSSYFQESRPRNERLTLMISQIDRIEYTVVDSEKESLILEANLINSHKPRYNILLKDDRSYVYARFTNDPIPGIFLTRSKYDPKSTYFGPYTKKSGIYNTLQTIRTLFPFCQEKRSQDRPCNYYSIKQCDGICDGLEDLNDYNQKLCQIQNILKGKTKPVKKYIQNHIKSAAAENNYELAGLWRDRLKILEETIADQKIVLSKPQDIDLVTFCITNSNENGSICSVFIQNIRSGRIINVNNFLLTGSDNDEIEFSFVRRFLSGYFNNKLDLAEVIIQVFNQNGDEFDQFQLEKNQVDLLTETLELKIYHPYNSHLNKKKINELLDLAKHNAIIYLQRNKLGQQLSIFEENNLFKAVVELKEKLYLKKLPRRIECYDISHLSGKFVYGSMVVFIDGRISKKNYRLFKTVEQNNDFENHKEVLRRRFERCLKWELDPDKKSDKNPWELPDLIIVDGGKGQLSSDLPLIDEYRQKFHENNLEFQVEISALAKREEEIFLPYNPNSIILSGHTKFLVQRVRDEAHRFAITNNRKARLKTVVKSQLDDIEGVGPKTKQKLLSTFGSTKKVIDTIYQNPELIHELVGQSTMNKIKKHFKIN